MEQMFTPRTKGMYRENDKGSVSGGEKALEFRIFLKTKHLNGNTS